MLLQIYCRRWCWATSSGAIIWRNSTEVNAIMSIWVWSENVTSWQYKLATFDFSLPCIDKKLDLYLSVQFQWKAIVSLSPSINLQFCYGFSSLWLRKFKHRRIFRSHCSYVPTHLCLWNSSTCCHVGISRKTMCLLCARTRNIKLCLLTEVVGFAHWSRGDRLLMGICLIFRGKNCLLKVSPYLGI